MIPPSGRSMEINFVKPGDTKTVRRHAAKFSARRRKEQRSTRSSFQLAAPETRRIAEEGFSIERLVSSDESYEHNDPPVVTLEEERPEKESQVRIKQPSRSLVQRRTSTRNLSVSFRPQSSSGDLRSLLGYRERTSIKRSGFFVLTGNHGLSKDTWIADSGAGATVINDKSLFISAEPLIFDVGTADGNGSLSVQGAGTIRVSFLNSIGETTDFVITEVAYAPDARCNLLSLSHLAKRCRIRGGWNREGLSLFTETGEEVAYAPMVNSLYHMQTKYSRPSRTPKTSHNKIFATVASRTLISPPPMLRSPYQTLTERSSLQFYLSRCMVQLEKIDGRQGFDFWHTTVLQLAWSNPSIRHALISRSLVQQALVCEPPNDGETGIFRAFLQQQNLAITTLTETNPHLPIMIVSAMLFRSNSLVNGDIDGAYRHSVAILKLLDSLGDFSNHKLSLTLSYIQILSKSTSDSWLAMNQSALNMSPYGTNVGADADLSISSNNCGCQQQQKFFHCIVELTIASRKLRGILHHLESNQWAPEERAKPSLLPLDEPNMIQVLQTFTRIVNFFYRRWTSTPYLDTYLCKHLARCYLRFRQQQQSTDYDAAPLASEFFSPSPFLLAIEELIDVEEILSSPTSQGDPTQSTNSDDGRQPFDFSALAWRLKNTAHLLVATTAGADSQLRKDIMEVARARMAAAEDSSTRE